ncbi:cysteine-rich repeat secretory protein 38-like, partial [Spinacia oleracea]|uniref:Cysteine-rich repeat secretory protein 38-like n=1 Tax=Spinacia oleracea TaxID=3562 RepID=A0A9R0JGK9_SPIOL
MGMPKGHYFSHYFYIFVQFHFISIAICQSSYVSYSCIDSYGNYTSNSPYQANLNTFFSSISSNTQINTHFYNFSIGEEPNRVNGIALCGGDVTFQECYRCLNDSIIMLPRLCPTQKEAFGWYDNCMLRYANRTLLGISEEQPAFPFVNPSYVTNNDVNQFNQVLGTLLNRVQNEAASGDSQLKFAIGNDSYSSFGNLPSCCANRMGARVNGPSCNARYEINQLFYNNNMPTPPSPPPLSASSPPPPPSGKQIRLLLPDPLLKVLYTFRFSMFLKVLYVFCFSSFLKVLYALFYSHLA